MSKVAIVGCGAMGSVYAALMMSAGHEVHAVTKWPDHAEAMASKGLRVEGASGDQSPIPTTTARIRNPFMMSLALSASRRM
jgi:2-dehydropantoate 2-reductase